VSVSQPSRPRLPYELRLTLLVLAAGLPAVVAAIYLLWHFDLAGRVRWTVAIPVVGIWIGCALALRERVVRPL